MYAGTARLPNRDDAAVLEEGLAGHAYTWTHLCSCYTSLKASKEIRLSFKCCTCQRPGALVQSCEIHP
jgi:hypothetical protein